MQKRQLFSAVLAVTVLGYTGAFAQVQTATCYLGGVSFTTGATAKAGENVMQCGADGTWIEYASTAALCIYNSQSYATGSIIEIGDSGITMQCLREGIWKER